MLPKCANVAMVSSALVLTGCAGPMVRYDRAENDAYNLKNGEIVFGIRSSDVAIVEVPMSVADRKADDRCSTGRPVETRDWAACLNRVSIQVSPGILDSPIYRARPGDSWSWLRHTKLSATSLGDDLPNVDAITVAYSDDTSQFITSVGSGATVGLAFGPWGALVGGIAGAVGGAAGGAAGTKALLIARGKPVAPSTDWHVRVCNDPLIKDKAAYLKDADQVGLSSDITPYVIPLEADTGCWHALPIGGSVEPRPPKTVGRFSGWFYRLVLGDAPAGYVRRDSAEAAKHFDGTPQADFPYVPCQKATLMMTWVDELIVSGPKDPVAYRSYTLAVANPAYLRFVDLPKGGTIKLGTNCGAQVAFGSYTGSTPQSSIDALLKQVGDFKAAQGK